MNTRQRTWAGAVGIAAAVALVGAALTTTAAVAAGADTAPQPADGDTVGLAQYVSAWPETYTVSGTKAEPLYTERITVTRDGSLFAVRIEAIGQGDAAMGTQKSVVDVDHGAVRWLEGCPKESAACADDPALRGFLATAAVVALAERGALPATGTVRTLHGHRVVCVADAQVHPDAPPAVVVLDPCLDPATGALLGHWSPDSAAFVGPTLAAGFTVSPDPDPDLLPLS